MSATELMNPNDVLAIGRQAVARFYWRERERADGTKLPKEPWVEISIPGSKTSIVHLKVRDEHKAEFPAHWAAFEAGLDSVVGTPIHQLPGLDRRQILELEALNIPTIETLAGISDLGIQRIGMNGRRLKEQAMQFLRTVGADAAGLAVRAENAELKARLAALEANMEKLMAPQSETLRGGPGRLPKETDDAVQR